MYYKHFMQKLEFTRMENGANEAVAIARDNFRVAAETIRHEAEQARTDSPGWTNKKRAPFRERKSAEQPAVEA